MKKKLLSVLLTVCMLILGVLGFVGCGGETPTPQKLPAPVVTLAENVATWEANTDADRFEISIDGNLSYVENTVVRKTLTNGQTLKVRAVGNGVAYLTSDWSNSVTYTESTPTPQPVKLGTPVVTVSETGLASWSAVANASGYVYKINGGAETPTTALSLQLANGQSITVKAVGDGTNYTDGDWSNSVTYTESTPTPQPVKLGTPVVTVSETGLASWSAVANASGYVYKINGGAETPTTALSLQLANGQSITVKAVGDGTNYTDGDWSNSVTYTENTPVPTQAPTYLGIVVSAEEPRQNDVPEGLLLGMAPMYNTGISLEAALRAFLEDSNNALGENVPIASDYAIYSAVGNTVYVQIWLENPDQNTILSLKLNGTKYQSGGALQSFFVEDGNSYLNCVYVAITIPNGSYNEISYEVTEIEYVEGTNISQDGKSVMIDEENDTVTIGLPYQQGLPTATVSNQSSTATSISFDVNVVDEDDFVNLVDGWLRVIIYNQNNEILGQQKLANGNNTVTFNNLSADTYYNVMVFVLGDTHDGNGVYVHSLDNTYHQTQSVISCELQSQTLQNEQTGKYYPVINVEAELSDASFTFTKVEVCDWGGTVYYTGDFDGLANITDGLLNGKQYVVKVYYENSLGVEQLYTDYVYVERLDYPWILEPCLQYGLMDDAILGFDFGDNKSNFDNLTIRIIDEYSKQYLAEDAIYLIDNPNAVAELEAQWQNYGEGWEELYDRWYKLDQAQGKINEYYPNVEKTEWQTELAKGIYSYEYVCGEDEQFFKVGNKYYVVLDGYQSQRVNDYSWKYVLTADFDMNDGAGVEEGRTIIDGWFDIKPAIGKNDYLFEEEFTLDEENGMVYLEVKSRNNLGDESYRNLGYVNQIVLADGYEIVCVLWTQDEPNHAIDEAAWLAAIKNALLVGEDVHSVFPLGELEPISFDIDDVEMPTSLVGNFDIRFTYIMYGKTYTQENPYTWDGSTIAYTVIGKLPQASININTKPVEDYGAYEIVIPNQVENGRWSYYSLEVKDGDGNPVGAYNQDNRIDRLSPDYSIRIKLDADPYVDYYTEGEWSDWFVCERGKVSAPIGFTQSYDVDGVTVAWQWIDRAEKYVYVINGGAEQETYETVISGLKNGDAIKVKAVPAIDSIFAESDYSELYTVIDMRTQLATPTNICVEDKMLMWDAVENASYYEIEYMPKEEIVVGESNSPEFYHLIIGKTYRIRACCEDVENYVASEWSEGFTYTVTLDNPTFNEIRRERVYWNSVENASGYNYKIGENGTVTSTRYYYVALADIPVGEKLYVQAYADGCESTEWVMIYHNVTVLDIPSVTVSGGVASWDAIENATGYVYKINDGEEISTTETSVSGLVSGDRIIVRAASTQNGYVDSEWSDERTQRPTMSAPVLDVSLFVSEGTISWGAVDGASTYEYDLDGFVNAILEMSVSDIQYGQSFKVRAVCDNGAYEQYGEWSELVVRVDTREQLATPVIAYDSETGLTVVANDSNVSCYEVIFGQDGLIIYHYPTGSGGTEVITQSFTFPSGENTVYVKAIPVDTLNYRESEWATVSINF